jgi:hypothetical protein
LFASCYGNQVVSAWRTLSRILQHVCGIGVQTSSINLMGGTDNLPNILWATTRVETKTCIFILHENGNFHIHIVTANIFSFTNAKVSPIGKTPFCKMVIANLHSDCPCFRNFSNFSKPIFSKKLCFCKISLLFLNKFVTI